MLFEQKLLLLLHKKYLHQHSQKLKTLQKKSWLWLFSDKFDNDENRIVTKDMFPYVTYRTGQDRMEQDRGRIDMT